MERISPEMMHVLAFVKEKLENHRVDWVLIGSVSLALQGVDVEPKDIDILTDKEGALSFNEIFKEFVVRPIEWSETEVFKSYFGRFQIRDVLVEVAGEMSEKEGNKWRSIAPRLHNHGWVKVEQMNIPVSFLQDQLESYQNSSIQKDRIRVPLIEKAIRLS
jgi:hypothetical protein